MSVIGEASAFGREQVAFPLLLGSRRRLVGAAVCAVVVLLMGGVLGWFMHAVRTQREALTAILRAGGTVCYDWHAKNGTENRQVGPAAPKWLVAWVGVVCFGSVVAVSLRGDRAEPNEDRVQCGFAAL
jgi:hypothetical protein